MKQGNGFDDGVTVGPMITMAAVEKVEAHVAQPTILTEATPKMRIFKEETFGPVAPLFRFQDEEDVIAMANDTEYGLAAYFYARDLGRVWRVAEALEYGMVAVNEGILSTEVAPFGGMKESGIGREGSKYGLDEFVELKYVLMGGLND